MSRCSWRGTKQIATKEPSMRVSARCKTIAIQKFVTRKPAIVLT